MRNYIKKIKTGYRVLVGIILIVLYNGTARLYYPESAVLGGIVAIAFLAFLVLCLTNKYEDPGKKSSSTEDSPDYLKQAQNLYAETELNLKRNEALISEIKSDLERLDAEKKASAEVEKETVQAMPTVLKKDKQDAPKYGRIFTKVVGVTFNNEDGSSRQKYLREAFAAPYGDVTLEQYEFEGEPAIRVMFNDWCIGHIPRNKIDEILPIMADITRNELTISNNDFGEDDIEDDLDDIFDDDRLPQRKKRRDSIYSATLVINYIEKKE